MLDRTLGRVTMYRLVTIVLVALVAVYALFTATGVIEGLSTGKNLIALLVLLVASVVSNRLLGLAWRLRPHTESAVITALLLFFLFVPVTEGTENLAWLAAAAVLANASKYVLAWRGRHVLNPAAAGAVLVVLLQDLVGRESSIFPIWQTAAMKELVWFVLVASAIVLWRTGRIGVGLAFLVPAYVLLVVGLVEGSDAPIGDAWQTVLYSFPLVFMAGFMVTEPLTLPPRRWQQLTVAVVTGVLSAVPVLVSIPGWTAPTLGPLSLTPEVVIVLGNLVAFALARRTGVSLVYRGKRQLGGDVWELAFVPSRPVRFLPGQYLELHLPHTKADTRGVRRVFSISSAPGAEELTVAIRVPEKSSSFKRALLELPPGTRLQATGVRGDFVLPSSRPALLVAGGIGVTPFLSQVRDGDASARSVLVYGVPDADVVPYGEELVASGVPVVLVSPTAPRTLPEGWTHVASPFISGDVLDEAVPDASSRQAFVSGPPVMVNAVRGELARRCRRVHTDYFSGY
ncbi:hypothetical protein ASD11_13815 [Aeromicrobium sp. Root495]|nr:hypothetical protein ASD11_13815 [Aeromicrobium sp. Root495]